MKQLTIFCIYLLIFVSCSSQQDKDESSFVISVVDDLGRTIKLTQYPKHIVSLAPNITEIIYALDAQDLLVGVTTYCDYPEQAKSKPKIGDFSNPSIERIISMGTELILMTSHEQSILLSKFENLDILVYVVYPKNMDELLRCIKHLGIILNREPQATNLIKTMRAEIDQVNQMVPTDSLPRVRVFFEISENPLMTVSNNTFEADLIRLARGDNIAANELSRDYSVISSERVVELDPEVIIILHPDCDIQKISSRLGWKNITAIRTNRVYNNLDPDLIVRPGPRAIQGLKELVNRFYSEQ